MSTPAAPQHPGPAQPPKRPPRFLVIGTVVNETVVRARDGARREHLGGVAAVMARELARHHLDTTLMTTGSATLGRTISDMGITPLMTADSPTPRATPRTVLTVLQTGQVRSQGTRPPMPRVSEQLQELQLDFDWILASMGITNHDLEVLAQMSAPEVALNATSTYQAPRLAKVPGKAVYTMNHQEAQRLARHLGLDRQDAIQESLNARTVLITRAEQGSTLYAEGQIPVRRPAAPADQQGDFVGAGDSVTAGLVHAISHDLDPQPTMDLYLSDLLDFNARSYS